MEYTEEETRRGVLPEQEESSSLKTKISRVAKLIFILSCYTALFITLMTQARWFLYSFTVDGRHINILDWLKCFPTSNCQPLPGWVAKSLGLDGLLITVFMAQHSLLAERNLNGTYIHRKVFIEWKINGALYTLTTAIALHVLMKYWTIVPIYIWNWPQMQPICMIIHVISWFALYGTTLMQDMPNLIGLHQVVFLRSNSRKTQQFKTMLKKQRHLGIIPFTLLIAVCAEMTLDRLLFLVVLLTYSYIMWRDSESFEYMQAMREKKRTRLSGAKEN